MSERIVFVRRSQVEEVTGQSTIYPCIKQALFVVPVRLGPRAVGWPMSEIQAMNADRVLGWQLLGPRRAPKTEELQNTTDLRE